MKIGIYGQFYHKNSETHIQAILNVLQSKGVEIVVEKNFLALMKENQSFPYRLIQPVQVLLN